MNEQEKEKLTQELAEAQEANRKFWGLIPGQAFDCHGTRCKFYFIDRGVSFGTKDGRTAWCLKSQAYTSLIYVEGDTELRWWRRCYISEHGDIDCVYTTPASESCKELAADLPDQITDIEHLMDKYYGADEPVYRAVVEGLHIQGLLDELKAFDDGQQRNSDCRA